MIGANSAAISFWFSRCNSFIWILSWWANLLSQVYLIICDDTGLDKIPLELGIKVNKEPAQVYLGKELLSENEINTGIPQGVGPDPLKDFHLLPWHILRKFWSTVSTEGVGILKALHVAGD